MASVPLRRQPCYPDPKRCGKRRRNEFLTRDPCEIDEGHGASALVLEELRGSHGDSRLPDPAGANDCRQAVDGQNLAQFSNLDVATNDRAELRQTAGGDVSTNPVDFDPNVVEDRELITGQNPRSDHPIAAKLIEALDRATATG